MRKRGCGSRIMERAQRCSRRPRRQQRARAARRCPCARPLRRAPRPRRCPPPPRGVGRLSSHTGAPGLAPPLLHRRRLRLQRGAERASPGGVPAGLPPLLAQAALSDPALAPTHRARGGSHGLAAHGQNLGFAIPNRRSPRGLEASSALLEVRRIKKTKEKET